MEKPLIKMPKMVCVCNAIKTTKFDRPNGMSCIEYWCNQKPDVEVTICPACHKEMLSEDIAGGHVIDYLNGSPHVFITPIHNECNTMKLKRGSFFVNVAHLVRVPTEDEKAILALNRSIIEKKRQFDRKIRRNLYPFNTHG